MNPHFVNGWDEGCRDADLLLDLADAFEHYFEALT
jgi:hypothetical protein